MHSPTNRKTSSPTCPRCQSTEFDLRVVRAEGVAATRCLKCSSHFLLLDSEDYWFDVIQRGYPRLARCSCGNESFRLSIDYRVRDDGDVDYVEVHSICSACGTTRRQLDFEVDYTDTNHLVQRPLVPIKNPKILYDLRDLNLLVTMPDIERIVDYLGGPGHCVFLSNMRSGDRWVPVVQDSAGVNATIEHGKYLFVYAMPIHIDVSEQRLNTVKKEEAFWKQSELIRIGSKSHVCTYSLDGTHSHIVERSDPPPPHSRDTELGLSLNMSFSNEFVRGEEVVSKSELFRHLTTGLLEMLQREFVSWRGRDSFDNADVNRRVHGDRFQRKAAARGKGR